VKLLLSEVLLPALCMVPSNVGLVNDVWGVLHYLDYHERWAIYNAHKVGAAPQQTWHWTCAWASLISGTLHFNMPPYGPSV
jgi:hypothetical protein